MTPKQFDRTAQILMVFGIGLVGFGARHVIYLEKPLWVGVLAVATGIVFLAVSVWLTKFANGNKVNI